MYFISTRGNERVTGAEAIVQGLAKDGGLFVPETFPAVTQEEFRAMAEMNYPDRAGIFSKRPAPRRILLSRAPIPPRS